jgi:hypothetical protein
MREGLVAGSRGWHDGDRRRLRTRGGAGRHDSCPGGRAHHRLQNMEESDRSARRKSAARRLAQKVEEDAVGSH